MWLLTWAGSSSDQPRSCLRGPCLEVAKPQILAQGGQTLSPEQSPPPRPRGCAAAARGSGRSESDASQVSRRSERGAAAACGVASRLAQLACPPGAGRRLGGGCHGACEDAWGRKHLVGANRFRIASAKVFAHWLAARFRARKAACRKSACWHCGSLHH